MKAMQTYLQTNLCISNCSPLVLSSSTPTLLITLGVIAKLSIWQLHKLPPSNLSHNSTYYHYNSTYYHLSYISITYIFTLIKVKLRG